MAKQVLSVGSIKNDGTGDSLRDGAKKINDNFTELYNALGATTGQLSLVSRLTAGDGVTVSSPSGAVLVTAKVASTTQLGSIIVGDNLTIDNDGVLSANAGGYTLPIAERGTLGGIKIGDSLQISETGVVNVIDDLYTLPTATSQVLGGVKIGSRLTITNGVLSADVQTIPTATTSVLGGVKIDGITIGINGSGVISVLSSGASLANGDHTFALNSDGTLSLDGELFTGSGGSGDRLTNGSDEVILEADGSITFPTKTTTDWADGTLTGPTLQMGNDPSSQVIITGPTPNNTYWDAQRLIIQGQQGYGGENNDKGEGGDVYIWAGSGGDPGSLQPRGDGGDVKLRGGHGGLNGGYVRIEPGNAEAEGGTGGFVEINAGTGYNTSGNGGYVRITGGDGSQNGGQIDITAGAGNDGTGGGFGGDVNIKSGYSPTTDYAGRVNIRAPYGPGYNEWSFRPDGGAVFPNDGNSAGYRLSPSIGNLVETGAGPTTVYVSTGNFVNGMKALISVITTGNVTQPGDLITTDTQIAEMLITVRYLSYDGAPAIKQAVATVYGVTHTSDIPLATFTVNVVPGPNGDAIEILAEPTSAVVNGMSVIVIATEILGTP